MNQRVKRSLLFLRSRRRNLPNPFYPRQLRRRRPWKRIIWSLILVLMVVAAFVFASPFFLVKNIFLEGISSLNVEEIKQAIQTELGERPYLFLVKGEPILAVLEKKFPIEFLKIKRQWPQTLFFLIKERTPAAAWQSGGEVWLIDQTGFVLTLLTPPEAPNPTLPLFFDESETEVKVGESILTQKILDLASALREKLASRHHLETKIFRLTNPGSSSLRVEITDGWSIYFDLNSNLDSQLTKLEALLRDTLNCLQTKDKTLKCKIEYIDLRFADRVYFK